MKRDALPFLMLVFALLGGVTIIYVVLVRPWTAMPAMTDLEMQRGWAQLEAWAGLPAEKDPPEVTGDPAGLIKAEMVLEQKRGDLDALIGEVSMGARAPLRSKDLPEEARIALRSLESWEAAGASLGPAQCGEALEALPLLTLGRMLLSVRGGDDKAEVERVLRLATVLRTSGDLKQVSVGFHLSVALLEEVQRRNLRPGDVLAAGRPRVEEVFAALSRDAVCSYRRARRNIDEQGFLTVLAGFTEEQAGPVFLRPLQKPERELATLRAYQIGRIKGAFDVRTNLSALQARMKLPPREAMPHSPLVRSEVTDPADFLERWREVLDTWDKALGAP